MDDQLFTGDEVAKKVAGGSVIIFNKQLHIFHTASNNN
jgi:ectoine hydroxylase-related dioxygenase (phytanoyl-CoA dioxygenase family)